jgi:hypothetical protein
MLLAHVTIILDAVGMGVPGLMGLVYGETATGAAVIHRQGDVDTCTIPNAAELFSLGLSTL